MPLYPREFECLKLTIRIEPEEIIRDIHGNPMIFCIDCKTAIDKLKSQCGFESTKDLPKILKDSV